jgi:aminoglycoside phosphotransferase (APT) family kinase protein
MSGSLEVMASRLEKRLITGAPQLGVQRIVSIERFSSGLSSKSYGIQAETADGPATWVMRVEPEHGVIPPYDIGREYRLIADMGKAGIPVPDVLHLEEDAEVVGGCFMLMSFVEGEVYRSGDPRFAEHPELTASMQAQFVEALARIHSAPQSVFPIYRDGRESARALIATCRRRLATVQRLPAPVLEHALDVLDRHAPEAPRLGLVHGDYRPPNIKWKTGKIEGILDWELATVGDPVADIAFTQTVGFGPCSIQGELMQRYTEITGVEIDPRRLAYHRMLEMAKSTIIGMGGASDLAHGGTDLRLLSVAALASAGQPMLVAMEAELQKFLEA